MHPSQIYGTAVLHDPAAGGWLLFDRPVSVLMARRPAEVLPVLAEVEGQVRRHQRFAAGFVAFEAAGGFDPALVTGFDPGGFPLVWFGLHRAPKTFRAGPQPTEPGPAVDWRPSLRGDEYAAAIRSIKRRIRSGDTYQVNFSYRLRATFAGDPWSLFARMVVAQGPHYAAFINADPWQVCSASPELFFRRQGAAVTSRPMKGTAARGLWPDQDREQARQLAASEKNRAESIMIVDMARNDLGRIAQPGTVRVDGLFAVEKYPTLWQMTASVVGKTTAPTSEVFRALFPAASITGAPKVRTMQLIAELERSPRRLYTGAIGFLAPQRRAQFSVAIRTALVNRAEGTAEYGVGGGIVWDSKPAAEFEECRVKARVLAQPRADFDLLETMLWEPATGFFLLDRHLARLSDSADYFSRPVDIEAIRSRLRQLETCLPGGAHRVRLVLTPTGKVTLAHRPFTRASGPYRLALPKMPICSSEPLLYHKTTHRRPHEQALAEHPGCDNVLLWNEKKELTESTIANLVVLMGGEFLTPPIRCGLLPGTYRSWLLSQGLVRERVIRLADLKRCSRLYLTNSVRGMWEAALV